MSKLSIIVAVAGKQRVIGKSGGMPWYIPDELKRFKEITMGHPIIMGRKTHESIGRVLSGRTNIIVTSNRSQITSNGVVVVSSIEEAIEQAKKSPGAEEIFIIGGGQIYQEAISLADKLYLTYIDKEIKGDVFFPDYSQFTKKVSESLWQENEGIRYKFLELEK
jgi:dihydrofolate reductase